MKRIIELKQYIDNQAIQQRLNIQQNEQNVYSMQIDIENNFDRIIENSFEFSDFNQVITGYMDRLIKIEKQTSVNSTYHQIQILFQQINH